MKEKKIKEDNQTQKALLNINNQSLIEVKWKNMKGYSYLKKFKRNGNIKINCKSKRSGSRSNERMRKSKWKREEV